MSSGREPSPVYALEMANISKQFGSVRALDDVSLAVRAGTVHALLGENGAGKSTLMRIAFGLERADRGRVRYRGASARGGSVGEAAKSGLGMVHQHLSLVPQLSATENVFLGGHGRFHPSRASADLARIARDAGLTVEPAALVRDLSIVEQQRLEILKALASDARVLILDEPTAVLAPGEAAELFAWIRQFVSGGGSVVFVTHKLREALSLADDITVLRRGRVTMQRAADGVTEAALAAAIFAQPSGSAAQASAGSQPVTGRVIAEAERVTTSDASGVTRLRDASIAVREGEIVGIAAVEGSGHRELLHALAGLRTPSTGRVRTPARIAIIPADRARDALVADFSLTENVALHDLGKRRGLMQWPREAERTRELISRFAITATSERVKARTLSGGNQQRLVIARELRDDIELVVADNPTRGLDLQAAAFVHDQLRAAARRGAGVLMHSSDLDEVLALSTRVAVVFHGGVVECGLDRDKIARAMLGAA